MYYSLLFLKMEEKRKSDRVKNALCFVPFFAIIIYFIEKNKTERITKNIIYAVFLLVFFIILPILPLLSFWFTWIIYLFISIFLVYKSYIWEDVDFEFIDKIFLKK